MDISSTLSIAASAVVTPLPSNGNMGGACYDGNGQALYGVYDSDGFKVYRTRNSYADLYTKDASVDYLSTVLTVAIKTSAAPSMALQRIGGTVHAVVTFWGADGTAGTWIYRDTKGGGVGPWVLHGTVQTITGRTGGNLMGMHPFASEVLVTSGGLWCLNAPAFGSFSSADLTSLGGVYTSTDAGATWVNRLTVGWYTQGIYGGGWSRNFGQWGGAWYVGGTGNVDGGKHFKSTDLISWTGLGNLGCDGDTFPVSDPGHIFRWQASSDYTSPRILQAATDAPENLPTWVTVADTSGIPFHTSGQAFPLMCNVAPDKGLALIVTNFGKVLGIAQRPTGMPPCRRYPRRDGLASSSAPTIYPHPDSRQGGYRKIGYY